MIFSVNNFTIEKKKKTTIFFVTLMNKTNEFKAIFIRKWCLLHVKNENLTHFAYQLCKKYEREKNNVGWSCTARKIEIFVYALNMSKNVNNCVYFDLFMQFKQ